MAKMRAAGMDPRDIAAEMTLAAKEAFE